jgi:hypothetical protein
MRLIFRLAFGCGLASNERPKTLVTAKIKKTRPLFAAVLALLASIVFALLISGCADVYYTDISANRTPEARYNTYYAPYYYPYYPWYSYYGGAYYYNE